ncbi:pentapeptide repeat-containing protein, partial [Rosistilla oblonga]|uniref:pentapeptide repeat-containing protein n=1 Tax=Rosistilla oblonga TaxID=2527990 RepID=UPI003A96BED2
MDHRVDRCLFAGKFFRRRQRADQLVVRDLVARLLYARHVGSLHIFGSGSGIVIGDLGDRISGYVEAVVFVVIIVVVVEAVFAVGVDSNFIDSNFIDSNFIDSNFIDSNFIDSNFI